MILGEQEKPFSYLQIGTIANAMNVSDDEIKRYFGYFWENEFDKVV